MLIMYFYITLHGLICVHFEVGWLKCDTYSIFKKH